MDFFGRQDQARRRTKWLVLYFALAVILTVAAIYLALALIFLRDTSAFGSAVELRLWHPRLFASVALGTLAVILGGSVFKTLALSQGGGAVAANLGGRLVNPATTDADERRLLNIVEEMAIASGVPVPDIYVLHEEHGINAFAAGNSIDDAAVGVTRGALKLLSRDELQGVIAHEFSHILNGDMRLNLRLMGIVHGILCIAVIGRVLLQTSTRRAYRLGARSQGKGGNPLPLVGLVLLAIGSIGVIFGRMIKSAVSRQREFLADAAAVQFTRNPAGLSGALKKIGGLVYGSRIGNPHAEEASHLFFGNGMGASWLGLLATHPPLEQRVKILEPSFDGKFPPVKADLPEPATPATQRTAPVRPPVLPGLPGAAFPAASALAQVGSPNAGHLNFAAAMMATLPEPLTGAAHDTAAACALVYALLLDRDPKVRAGQLRELEDMTWAATYEALARILPDVDALEPKARIALVELCFPALRLLSRAQFDEFDAVVRHMIESDRRIDLFEFALQKMLMRHLAPHFRPARRTVIQYYVLKPLLPDCTVILSALARLGDGRPESVEAAFTTGVRQLGPEAGELALLPYDQSNLPQIDAALNRLCQSSPMVRKQVLNACAFTVAADGVIQPAEAELLRAIADVLDCPIPPLLRPAP